MKINAIAPWFGGKRTLAVWIVAELGKHSFYYEGMCGGLAVLFGKPPSSHEVVNDLHGGLINLAMVVASERWEALYECAGRIMHCDALYKTIRESVKEDEAFAPSPAEVTDEHVQTALNYLALWWLGRNGTAGTERYKYQMAHRHTPGGGAGPIRWRSVLQSIPEWHARLMNVDIRNEDTFILTPKMADVEGMVMYFDPTYLRDGKSRSGSSVYQHEFTDSTGKANAKNDQHQQLRDMLVKFQYARIVISYYDHPRIRELYDGWTFINCYRQKNLHVQNRRGIGKCEAPEILIVNGPQLSNIS